MQQTVDADVDVKEEVAIIPVCGLSSYYFSADAVTTAEAAFSAAVDVTMTADAITTPVAASGLSSLSLSSATVAAAN